MIEGSLKAKFHVYCIKRKTLSSECYRSDISNEEGENSRVRGCASVLSKGCTAAFIKNHKVTNWQWYQFKSHVIKNAIFICMLVLFFPLIHIPFTSGAMIGRKCILLSMDHGDHGVVGLDGHSFFFFIFLFHFGPFSLFACHISWSGWTMRSDLTKFDDLVGFGSMSGGFRAGWGKA